MRVVGLGFVVLGLVWVDMGSEVVVAWEGGWIARPRSLAHPLTKQIIKII
jgi:hypothetical protein